MRFSSKYFVGSFAFALLVAIAFLTNFQPKWESQAPPRLPSNLSSLSDYSWWRQPEGTSRDSDAERLLNSRKAVDSAYTRQALLSEFDKLEPWGKDSNLSDYGWMSAKVVAKMIQESDPRIVAASLDDFVRLSQRRVFDLARKGQGGDFSELSKVYILLRVAFELPESMPEAYMGFWNLTPGYGGDTVGWETVPKTGKLWTNLAWPIEWNQGQPKIIAAFGGYEGQPYDASSEYVYFLLRYPFRELEK